MRQEIGTPASPDIVRRVEESFGRQGLMAHLGARVHEVRHGVVTIRMPYRAELTQQHGYFHAGGTSSIADTAGGYAGLTMFPENASVLTVEFKLNLIAPAEGEVLEAVGRVVKSGRTLTICQLEVVAENAGRRTVVAVGMQTLICLVGKADGPAA